jgi:hypothetical protein
MILTTGCSDDSSSPAGAATDISKSDDGDAMVFEMQDGTYELNITAEGPWHIEDSTHFVQSISQTEGTGPATVELKVLTNDLDERLEGNLFIVSDDPNQDRTIKCVQKYYGDYGENAPSDIGKSNKIYAVGYGYNDYDLRRYGKVTVQLPEHQLYRKIVHGDNGRRSRLQDGTKHGHRREAGQLPGRNRELAQPGRFRQHFLRIRARLHQHGNRGRLERNFA